MPKADICVYDMQCILTPRFLKHSVGIEDKGTLHPHTTSAQSQTRGPKAIGNDLKHFTSVRLNAQFDRKHPPTIHSTSPHSVTKQALKDWLAHDLDSTRHSQSAATHLALTLLSFNLFPARTPKMGTHTPQTSSNTAATGW